MNALRVLAVLVCAWWIGRAGYELGKHDADKWYAAHPPVIEGVGAPQGPCGENSRIYIDRKDSQLYTCIIAPQKLRVPSGQAQIEQPKETK
jgi:hypothetical protein